MTAYRFSGRLDSPGHWQALKHLAAAVATVDPGAIGQRGPGPSPLLNWLAEIVLSGALPELVAALQIANYCGARGGDWSEAVEIFWPRYPNEPDGEFGNWSETGL